MDRGWGKNLLSRQSESLRKAGAQDFVPLADVIEAGLESVNIESAPQAHGSWNVVSTAARFELVDEPQSLLRK